MRNLLSLLFIAVACVCISCGGKSGGMSATAKKNLAVNDSITNAYQSGNFDKMGDYIAADAIDHGGENGDVKGLENIVADMKRYHAMMPDMKTTMSRSMADDEYVYSWSTTTGSMNGKPITMTGVDVAKFKDGKAVEHWIYMDPKEVAQMMQSMPQPGTDTTTAPKQ